MDYGIHKKNIIGDQITQTWNGFQNLALSSILQAWGHLEMIIYNIDVIQPA